MTTRSTHSPALLKKNRIYFKKSLRSILCDMQIRYHTSLPCFNCNTKRKQPDLTPPINIHGSITGRVHWPIYPAGDLLLKLGHGIDSRCLCSWPKLTISTLYTIHNFVFRYISNSCYTFQVDIQNDTLNAMKNIPPSAHLAKANSLNYID